MSEMEDQLMKLWETNRCLFYVTAKSTIETKLCADVHSLSIGFFSLVYLSIAKLLTANITVHA